MIQTLSEQILSHAAGQQVRAGDLAVVEVDRAMTIDSIAPEVIEVLENQLNVHRLPYPERLAIFIDHVAPASNLATAEGQIKARKFAQAQGIEEFYDSGSGICHQLMVEKNLVKPGMVALGSDSHSTTYGAVAAFGTGMGTTDIALAFATGRTWLRVPETIRIDLVGDLHPMVDAKDVVLYLLDRNQADGFTYKAIEFHGAENLTLSSRMTLCSMTTEMGAKVGIVPPDTLTRSISSVPEWLSIQNGANYIDRFTVNLAEIVPLVALPPHVDNIAAASTIDSIAIDQVYLGTCTNGRLQDLHSAAEILRGKHIAPGVRMIVVPASHQVLQDAVADGTVGTLLQAGATIGTPGCGACIGRHMGVLGAGETCLTTGNRNFSGRMGSPDAKIYLGSPQVAAATALRGVITDPQDL